MLSTEAVQALILLAAKARENAHAPYSGYRVGAAVVAEGERVYAGCNVENASCGLSLCAERAAIAGAIACGEKRLIAVVVVTEADPPATPCGACRQWLAEFGGDDLEIIAANLRGQTRRFTLKQLLPEAFRLDPDRPRSR